MLLVMYSFNKKQNSTKQPTADNIEVSGEVRLKADTSLRTPTFIMAIGAPDMPRALRCNYAVYNNTYYWITDIVHLSNSHIAVTCEIDVLANYRNEILITKAHVLFSESHGRSDITDIRTTETCVVEKYSDSVVCDLFTSGTGCYILTVISTNAYKYGGFTASYVLSADEMQALSDKLVQPEFLDWAVQYFTNPFQSVVKCLWLPVSVGNFDDTIKREIMIGTYSTEIHAIPLNTLYLLAKNDCTIPWNNGGIFTYKDFAPFAKAQLYLPYIGLVELPINELWGVDSIEIHTSIDPLSGGLVYKLLANGKTLSTYCGTCGTNCPVAQSGGNFDSAANSIVSIGGATAAYKSKLGMGSTLGMVGFGITSAIHALSNQTQINGTIGSRAGGALGHSFEITYVRKKLSESVESKRSVFGLPLYQTVQLSNLSGYVQTQNVSVSAVGDINLLNKVNEYLDGGVYLE